MSIASETTARVRNRVSPMTPIRQHRLRAGLSQVALASRAQVSPGWLSVVEREPEFLSPAVAARLATVLGCSSTDLLPEGTR
jgi:transcriptional regulator with XRE-family HTH domain